jgi:hypothetical protein
LGFPLLVENEQALDPPKLALAELRPEIGTFLPGETTFFFLARREVEIDVLSCFS